MARTAVVANFHDAGAHRPLRTGTVRVPLGQDARGADRAGGKLFDPMAAQLIVADMDHSPEFLKVVNEVRPRIKEITLDEARTRLARNPNAI